MITGDIIRRFTPDHLPLVVATLGATVTLGCPGTWYEFFWGDGNLDRVLSFSGAAVFMAHLWVRAVLSLRGNRRGRALLPFGALPLVLDSPLFLALWGMWERPEFRKYLWSRPPPTPMPSDPPAG
jgi:hypothetical protein